MEQTGAIIHIDAHLYGEGMLFGRAPIHSNETLSLFIIGLNAQDVGAVLAMDRDAAPSRHVAHNILARQRLTALGDMRQQATGALDSDVRCKTLERQRGRRPGLLQRLDLLFSLMPGVILQTIHELFAIHIPNRNSREKIVDILETLVKDRADFLHRIREVQSAEQLIYHQAPLRSVFLAALLAEPAANLLAGAVGLDESQVFIQPMAARPPAPIDDDFHLIAGLQLIVQRRPDPIDPRASALMADFSVDVVGEVNRRRPHGQIDDLALRREDVDAILEDIEANGVDEIASVAFVLGQFLDTLAHPSHLIHHLITEGNVALFVAPMRRDAILRNVMHPLRADLNL